MQNAKESYWVVTMALPFVRKAAAPFLGGAGGGETWFNVSPMRFLR